MRKYQKKSRKGFTLSEVLVVMVIIGICITMVSFLFLSNWLSYEVELTRLNFQGQANKVLPILAQDVMTSRLFTITDPQNFSLSYPTILGRPNITYSINTNGQLIRTEVGSNALILTEQLDFSASSFQNGEGGFSLICILTFIDDVFTRPVNFTVSREIARRNRM